MTYTISDMRKAKAYYKEFQGESPTQDEVASPEDMIWVKSGKPAATTYGFEVEQKADDISYSLRHDSSFTWHRDASGPLETTFGPSTYPAALVKQFLEECKRYGTWKWKSEYGGISLLTSSSAWKGCGSHIHFRVREDMVGHVNKLKAWTTAYNTMVSATALLAPMYAWGHTGEVFTYRRSLLRWAEITTRRMRPASVEDKLTALGRDYKSVTFNNKSGKPLTLEIRLGETHTAFAYAAALMLNRIIRASIEREFNSPKIRNHREVLAGVTTAIQRSTSMRENLYDAMQDNIPDIQFIRGRSIPKLKQDYPDWKSFWKDLFRKYTAKYPPMARCCKLFKNFGEPNENGRAAWNIFNDYGDFYWDTGIKAK